MNLTLIAGLVAAAVGFGAGWSTRAYIAGHDIAVLKTEHANRENEWMASVVKQTEDAKKREAEARAEERRTSLRIKEVADATNAKLEASLASATALLSRTRGLYSAAEATAAAARLSCSAASNPTATAPGSPATDPGAVLANVLGEIGEAYAAMATEADQRGIRGSACERAYDAVASEPAASAPL